jgi:anionic cell wall polymer biosynthesis LytR-Cps2A-Psr (LCP) family protein
MEEAVEGVTGLTIQYYVLIDMQGFSDLIDALGGVTINVTERVPVGGDEQLNGVAEWIEPGEQVMNGYYALWYARSRHGDSDYARMERQRQLQEAILQQFTPTNVLSKFQVIAEAGAQVVKTNVPESMLGYFANLAMKTKELPINTIELTPANNIVPENPDFDYIHELISTTLNPPTPEPTEGG